MATNRTRRNRLTAALLTCAFGLGTFGPGAAHAQGNAASASTPAPKRQIDGEKILQLLVAKGLVSQADADTIVTQATVPEQPVLAGGVQGDTQTVPYIPQVVRDQIRSSIVAEMAQKGETEGWARPGEVAGWTKRITLSGDLRVRGEGIFFPKSRLGAIDPVTNLRPTLAGNDPYIVNFGAINTGLPYNANRKSPSFLSPPFLNTTENRYRARLRARLGLGIDLARWAHAEVRLATGGTNSPISTNQTLGVGNGDFSKYAIWLDRASIQFRPHGWLEGTKLVIGRAANPFWFNPLLFDEDLNFDGLSLAVSKPVAGDIRVFSTLGAFPTYNTDLNFGSRDVGAFKSRDRWLLAAQLGGEVKIAKRAKITAAAGFFKFTGAKGKFSSPCLFDADACDTDHTRPLFQQYGNSIRAIRNIIPNPSAPPGLSPEPQYFGLASDFRVFEAHAALEFNPDRRVPVRLEGAYLRNFGFKRAQVLAIQTNVMGDYKPGGQAWSANLMVGKQYPANRGEWNLFGGYRRIGTDATIDGFNDSNFHLGGTNAKGYVIGGNIGLGDNIALGTRWLSADEITGQPYAIDALYVDLNARF